MVGTLDAVRLAVDAPLTERSEPVRAGVVHHDPLAAVVTVDDVTLPKEANWGGSIGIKLVGACKGHPRAWESRGRIQSGKVGSEGRSGRGGAGDGCGHAFRQRWAQHGPIDEQGGKGHEKGGKHRCDRFLQAFVGERGPSVVMTSLAAGV